MRFLLGSPERLERVRLAIDQYHGLRDARGRPVPAVNRVMRAGAQVGELSAADYCERMGVEPTSLAGPLCVIGGSAVLGVPDTKQVNECLGKRVRGAEIPGAGELVSWSELPDAVRAALGGG